MWNKNTKYIFELPLSSHANGKTFMNDFAGYIWPSGRIVDRPGLDYQIFSLSPAQVLRIGIEILYSIL